MKEIAIFTLQPDSFGFYQEEKGFKPKCSWKKPKIWTKRKSKRKRKIRRIIVLGLDNVGKITILNVHNNQTYLHFQLYLISLLLDWLLDFSIISIIIFCSFLSTLSKSSSELSSWLADLSFSETSNTGLKG